MKEFGMYRKKKFLSIMLTKESALLVVDINTVLELFIFLSKYTFLLTDTTPEIIFSKRDFSIPGDISTPKRNGARYLDPKYSRWLSTDPALSSYVERNYNGPSGGIYNSVNLNLYHYGGNNPIKYVDPDGREDWEELGNQALEETKRTFNGDFGADFFSLSWLAYDNGDYLKCFGYSLDGTAEFFLDLVGAYKLAQGLGYLVDKIGSAFTSKSLASSTNSSAETSTEIIKRYGPMNKGPLPENLANTFRGGSYSQVTLQSDTTLYRVYGGTANKMGMFWTRTEPTGPLQAQIDLALKPEWGNTAANVVKIKVPAGTTIFEGFAENQGGGLLGGGNQVIIRNVNPNWEIP